MWMEKNKQRAVIECFLNSLSHVTYCGSHAMSLLVNWTNIQYDGLCTLFRYSAYCACSHNNHRYHVIIQTAARCDQVDSSADRLKSDSPAVWTVCLCTQCLPLPPCERAGDADDVCNIKDRIYSSRRQINMRAQLVIERGVCRNAWLLTDISVIQTGLGGF